MGRSTTLEEIASRVGVHRSTVALALRGNPRISAPTRERIEAVARELGYRMDPMVAALMHSRRSGRSGRHETIAFVTNYPNRFGWRPNHHDRPDFFPGAAQRADDLGYRLEHFWLAEPGMTPQRFAHILLTRNIHGLLLARMPPGQHSIELPWKYFSVVALGMTLRSPQFLRVTENHFDTAAQCLQRCEELGYRRVGFVFSEANDSPSVGDRWLGSYLQFQRLHPNLETVPICPGMPTDRVRFAHWFQQERPDALLTTHAKPVLGWLRFLGRKVPDDLGLIELQHDPAAGVAGVYHDPGKIGAVAIEVLAGLLYRNENGVPAESREIMLTGEWREGRTLVRAKDQPPGVVTPIQNFHENIPANPANLRRIARNRNRRGKGNDPDSIRFAHPVV